MNPCPEGMKKFNKDVNSSNSCSSSNSSSRGSSSGGFVCVRTRSVFTFRVRAEVTLQLTKRNIMPRCVCKAACGGQLDSDTLSLCLGPGCLSLAPAVTVE